MTVAFLLPHSPQVLQYHHARLDFSVDQLLKILMIDEVIKCPVSSFSRLLVLSVVLVIHKGLAMEHYSTLLVVSGLTLANE